MFVLYCTLFVKLKIIPLICRPDPKACNNPLWKSSLPYKPTNYIEISFYFNKLNKS